MPNEKNHPVFLEDLIFVGLKYFWKPNIFLNLIYLEASYFLGPNIFGGPNVFWEIFFLIFVKE